MPVIVFLAFTLAAQPGLTAQYNISASKDYTGLYAVVMPFVDTTINALFGWWNETKGKEMGITLTEKAYDMRFDPSVVASTWPSILSGDKPICHLGLGGCDVAALMKRLPKDKVPMVLSTGTYGFAWLPNQWVFQTRPTYPHETAGFLNWVHLTKIKDRPIQVGILSSKASPAYEDMVNGFMGFAKVTPWIKVVGTEWAEVKPVSLVSEIRRLSREKPDYIWIATTAAQVIGAIKAEKELGVHIPILMSSHDGIAMCNTAVKNLSLFEGHYDVWSGDPGLDASVPGAKLVMDRWKKTGVQAQWNLMSVQSFLMTMLALKAVERAGTMVGPDKITGEAVYNAMFLKPFTEEDFLGLGPTMTFSKEAPFSIKDLKVKITTVQKGQHVLASPEWIPVPEVPKWVK